MVGALVDGGYKGVECYTDENAAPASPARGVGYTLKGIHEAQTTFHRATKRILWEKGRGLRGDRPMFRRRKGDWCENAVSLGAIIGYHGDFGRLTTDML